MSPLQTKVDNVKNAVSSTSTCTPATVTLLSELLLPKASIPSQNDSKKITVTKKAPRVTSAIQGKAKRPVNANIKTPSASVKQSTSANDSHLSPKEQAILATEVINYTLKALDTAIKAPAEARRQNSTQVKKTHARQTLRRSSSVPHSPLSPRTLERVASSPAISTKYRSSSTTSLEILGSRSVAECARIAFSCLRTTQSAKIAGVDLPHLRLENGMSALIGKFITLGLEDLAAKELRILKRRLDGECGASPELSAKKNAIEAASSSNGQLTSLADLLEFHAAPSSPAVLSLCISTQLQVLKLLSRGKRSHALEAALPKLDTNRPGSAIQLLLYAAKAGPSSLAKSAKQLETMSLLILSSTPSISSADDTAAMNPKSAPAPETAFQLQSLSYRLRMIWWEICGHEANIEKELLDPFSRCLSAYSRRYQCPADKAYDYAKSAFSSLEKLASMLEPAPKCSITTIYKILGSLSQEAGNYEEAAHWTRLLKELYNKSKTSDAQKCAIAARLVSLNLQLSPADQDVEELMVGILDGIQGPLRGESHELDELVLDITMVRKIAVSLISNRKTGPGKSSSLRLPEGTRQVCESFIIICPRFTLRYLGKPPAAGSNPKSVISYEQRRKLVSRFIYPTIDSALYLIKTFRSEGRLTWDLMDATLQDCLALLEAVGADLPEPADTTKAMPSYFVKISHLYYTQYLDFQRDTEDSKDTLRMRALRRSIDCVRNGTSTERVTAFMTMKLERLSNIYAAVGRFDDAKEAATSLRDELIGADILSRIVELARSEPLHIAWSHDDDIVVLARVLSSLVRFELRIGSKSLSGIAGYDSKWTTEGKGIVLEQILETLGGQTKDVSALTQMVAAELLSTYDAKSFPIRRLRILAQLLNLGDQQRDLRADVRSTIAAISIEGIVKDSKDAGLQRYASHLTALALSGVEMREDHPRADLLRQHLEIWSSMLSGSMTFNGLAGKVENVDKLIYHLQSVADFLDLAAASTTRIAVLKMIAMLNDINTQASTPDDLILSYTALGIQYLHMGYSGKAGLALDRAQQQSQQKGASYHGQLRYHLAHAEYLLAIGNADKCEKSLSSAQEIASQHFDASKDGRHSKDKTELTHLLADAAIVHSALALERGILPAALLYARRGVRLLYVLWDMAERHAKNRPASSVSITIREPVVSEEDGSNATAFAAVADVKAGQSVPGPSFWGLIPSLFRSLSWLSQIYAHHGMYQETMYYAEQANKLVQSSGIKGLSSAAAAAMSTVCLRAGALDRAADLVSGAKEQAASIPTSSVSVAVNIQFAQLHKSLGNTEGEIAAYDETQIIVDSLLDVKYIENLDRIIDPAAALEAEMSKLTIIARKTTTSRKLPGRAAIAKKSSSSRAKAPVESPNSIQDECLGVRSLKGQLLRLKAQAFLSLKRRDEALAMLQMAGDMCCGSQDSIDQQLSLARQLLSQGMEQMATDPVFSVLQDSTISFPSAASASNKGTTQSDKTPAPKPSPPRKVTTNARCKSPHGTSFYEKLYQAQDHLLEAYAVASYTSSPTFVIQKISSLLNATMLLSSAASNSKSKTVAHPTFATCSIEMTRTNILQREMSALGDGINSKGGDLQWPCMNDVIAETKETSFNLNHDILRFQKEYIDIIPSSWTAISISLSENKQDLCITKIQSGHSPFTLRLPLGRNNSRDMDEDVFDFETGRTELREIVEMANESAHGARSVTGKGGKTAWWTERDSLDLRMKDLLENVEKVWLGGFKGIFSQHIRCPDLLARFQRSFQNILDKHLPSRRKTGRKAKVSQPVTLDTRILDLFIGLGNPSEPDADFDEPLTDLLYFVIDILQFHGERNAYDEIDFDSIVVETHDALRYYHEALLSSSTSTEDQHTILILDKALHAFPWESLPCMNGLPVSRMPSLGCLRDRILEQQKSPQEGMADGYYISRSKGAYILNPSGDLKHTEATFTPILNPLSLPDTQVIKNRAPTETEFANLLSQSSYLLYFGHGAGTQYIRPKTIRRLDSKPAVSFLMGCSSGALTEVGEFEPYGTPINYLLAGCPALVANLWDVTDRDCDRFAIGALEEWGLIEEETTKKGKGKPKAMKKEKKQSSLVQAVAKARDRCQYRYLTAAAVCVYGIPVYLK